MLELQRGLLAAGHDPGPRDGVFGSKTAAAVSAYQRSVGFPATGAADQATWERLFTSTVLLRRGSTGPAVVEVQQRPRQTQQILSDGLLRQRIDLDRVDR